MITRRTKIIGTISASFFTVSLMLLAAFMVMLRVSEMELEEKKIQVAEAQNHEHELSSLVRLVEETENERQEIISHILREEEVIDFLALIEDLGREQGVELETTSLDVVSVDEVFDELKLDVSIVGPRLAVIHMLKLFETLPYQSRISRTSLSQTSGGSGIDSWNGVFSLHVTKYK